MFLQRLGDVYRDGGLSKLQDLKFFFALFDGESSKAWMNAVLSSSHKGAALREMEFEGCNEVGDINISLAFVDALSVGHFPILK